jgi:hypothetical protein
MPGIVRGYPVGWLCNDVGRLDDRGMVDGIPKKNKK